MANASIGCEGNVNQKKDSIISNLSVLRLKKKFNHKLQQLTFLWMKFSLKNSPRSFK